jgi:hypothetical protein
MNLNPYRTIDWTEASLYKNIPIGHRQLVLDHFRSVGVPVRLRYRGRRTQGSRFQRRSYCLLKDADRFSVYIK